jgi:carbonic anhydrase
VIGETVLGSLEYAVEVLKVPLILVLGHDECGAIRAAINASNGSLNSKGEFIHQLVASIQPTVSKANSAGSGDIDSVTGLHIEDTIQEMLTKSKLIAEAIEAGNLAVIGAKYKLSGGEVHPLAVFGQI